MYVNHNTNYTRDFDACNGIRQLSDFLTEKKEQEITILNFDDNQDYSSGSKVFKITDACKINIPNISNKSYISNDTCLYKLQFDGDFTNEFMLEIYIAGNRVAIYKAPYRYILKYNNELIFHIPYIIHALIELNITGFTGEITAFSRKSFDKKCCMFEQYSGRMMFFSLTTDLMIESPDGNPIDNVTLYVKNRDGDKNTVVHFDRKMLDAMYTKFTDKSDRPELFAVCSIKNKELRFDRFVELRDVKVNGVSINCNKIHYHTYDLFLYSEGLMINRYSC